MIVLAGLCLPPATQGIQVTSHIFGAEAVATVGDVRIIWEMETDDLGGGKTQQRACERDACVGFEREHGGGSAPGVFRIRVGGVRNLSIEAPDRARLMSTLGKMGLVAEGPNGLVSVPLTAFLP